LPSSPASGGAADARGRPEAVEVRLLRRRQGPHGPLRQISERQAADGDAHEAQDLDAERAEHPADLAVAALVEHDCEPGVAPAGPEHGRRPRAQALAVDHEARREAREHGLVGHAVDLHVIGLLDAGGRIEKTLRPARVVGEEEQPLARLVEAADRGDERQVEALEAVIDRRAFLRVVSRGDEAPRLVEHQIDLARGDDALAIDGDARPAGVDPDRCVADRAAVERDAAFGDERLCLGARAEPELGQGARQADDGACGTAGSDRPPRPRRLHGRAPGRRQAREWCRQERGPWCN